jgi:hypothetical protein
LIQVSSRLLRKQDISVGAERDISSAFFANAIRRFLSLEFQASYMTSWAASMAFSSGPPANLASNGAIMCWSGSRLDADPRAFLLRFFGGDFVIVGSPCVDAIERNPQIYPQQSKRTRAKLSENVVL